MAMRWKKNPRPTGLAGVVAGPQGSTLRIDGEAVASVCAHQRQGSRGWYWVAFGLVPHRNTCNEEPCESDDKAKAAATAYVKAKIAERERRGGRA